MSPSSGSGGDAGASVVAGSSIGAVSVTLVRPRCGTRSAAGLRLPQRAASGPPTPPGAGGSSTRQSLRLLDVAVEGETTIGVGAEPVRDSTQVGEVHTLRAAAFKQLRGESLAGVHANVGEAYASTEDIRVLRSFDHSRAKHYPH